MVRVALENVPVAELDVSVTVTAAAGAFGNCTVIGLDCEPAVRVTGAEEKVRAGCGQVWKVFHWVANAAPESTVEHQLGRQAPMPGSEEDCAESRIAAARRSAIAPVSFANSVGSMSFRLLGAQAKPKWSWAWPILA